ncbi:hypothetical protein FRC07_002850, partial [Ceratobasidium sp. 392]
MPNALTMYLLWNTVFMFFMQVMMWLRYFTVHTPRLSGKSSLLFWYSFAYIWNGVGIWLSTFGTLYTILLPRLLALASSKRRIVRVVLHPISLNMLCFVPPLIFILAQIATSICAAVTWSKLVRTNSLLINMLSDNNLTARWDASSESKIDDALRQRADPICNLLVQQERNAQVGYRASAETCATWYWLCLILFVPTAIWLMSVLSKSISQKARHTKSRIAPSKAEATSWPASSGVSSEVAHDQARKHLKWAYSTVGLQFLATCFYTVAAAGAWLWSLVHAERLVESGKLRSYLVL